METYTFTIKKINDSDQTEFFNKFIKNMLLLGTFAYISSQGTKKISSLLENIDENIFNNLSGIFKGEHIVNGKKIKYEINGQSIKPMFEEQLLFTKESPELLKRLSLIFIVSCFDLYFANLVKEYYISDIRRLKLSVRKLSYNEILEYRSMEELHDYIIEKECEKMVYMSYKDRLKYIKDVMRIDFLDEELFLTETSNIIKIRNIVVHNDGIVNSLFLKQVQNTNYKIGDNIVLNNEFIIKSAGILYIVLQIIDNKIKHFFTNI